MRAAGCRRDLLAVVRKIIVIEPAFEIGAGVNARRGVRLKVDQVAREVSAASTEEMIETDFK